MNEPLPAPNLPETLEMVPLSKPAHAVPRLPGSKSLTNRALILAALAGRGRGCQLQRILRSEDTQVMIVALQALGFDVQLEANWPLDPQLPVDTPWPNSWTAHVGSPGQAERIPAGQADLFVANSGTSMRFLTALVSLGQGRYRLDGSARMRERPIEDLLSALRQLGARAYSERQDGCPPVIVEASGLNGGRVRIRGDISSQFLSGLLMVAPLARGDVTIELEGKLVSQPYVAMTTALMRQCGIQMDEEAGTSFHISGRQEYRSRGLVIEPDASAASYFFAAAAITQGSAFIVGLSQRSLQGDVRFVEVLKHMGCQVWENRSALEVRGGPLRGIDIDMNDISDCVMTLAAVACFAEGPTTIRNVAHIRHKETDRLQALATELRRVGAGVEEFADGLRITPGSLHGAMIETYNDHRMAMSMALVGLKVPGIVIRNPGCVAKTYPNFFEDLERLRC